MFIVFLNDLAGELDINLNFDNNREFIDMFQKFILLFAEDTLLLAESPTELFKSLVQPILMYGCEIWGFHKADDIERVHVNFLKHILVVRRQTSNIAVYGEVDRVPLSVVRKVHILKYWYKILSSRGTLLFKASR